MTATVEHVHTSVEVSVVPWALVRLATLVLGPVSPAQVRCAEIVDRLASALAEQEKLRPFVEDELFGQAGSPPDMGVVAVRRSVHNRRTPRADAVAALGVRGPRLTSWLRAGAAARAAEGELAAAWQPALEGGRIELSTMCAQESVRRSAAMVSRELLAAILRAADRSGAPDRRAAKSEATVLRHVLRAATRTTPLTWSAAAAWGRHSQHGVLDDLDAPLACDAHCEPHRAALDEVRTALQAGDDDRPLTLAPGAWTDQGNLVFGRSSVLAGGVRREETVSIAVRPQLLAVLAQGGSFGELAARLASHLPGAETAALASAGRYLQRLHHEGLLVTTPATDPQDPRPLEALARYAAARRQPEIARTLHRIDTETRRFGTVDSPGRAAQLDRLRSLWDELPGTTPQRPLTEDVTIRSPLHVGTAPTSDDLRPLAPLFEVFDAFTVIRRAARDAFVDRFGPGGVCGSVAEFATQYAALWTGPQLVGPAGELHPAAGPALTELASLRARLVALAHAAQRSVPCDVVLPEELLDAASRGLPGWARGRPASYAVFAQPNDGGGHSVNQVYGGWGRFTSRFLDGLGPDAAADVTATIRAGLPPGSRPVQARPVGGFNANIHPLLVPEEVLDAPCGRASASGLPAGDIELVHIVESDQLRLRHRPSGELLDVLYLGFLVPLGLPPRLVPLLNDLGSGLVDLAGLRRPEMLSTPRGPVTVLPRVVSGRTVLLRRRWLLGVDQVAALRAELEQNRLSPGPVAARLRAELGVPRHVFVGGGPSVRRQTPDLSEVIEHMGRARPQYVDLSAPLHLASLSRTLARYPAGIAVEEALPVPRPGRRVVEYVVETYRR